MGKHSSSPELSFLLIFLLLLQLTSTLKSQNITAGLPESEVKALNTIESKLGMKQSVGYTSSSCSERGYMNKISCSNDSGNYHVISLSFRNLDLSGVIPQELVDLTYLRELDLSHNQLHGPIPAVLGNLSSLLNLDLSFNYLIGSIPESLGKMHSLKELYLYSNFLNGKIPPTLGEMSSLQDLSLRQNLLSGPVPDELGNITSLEFLILSENRLSGVLPPLLGKLTHLQLFSIMSNNITGELPQSFANLRSLLGFYILGNSMSGGIPAFIQNWTQLLSLVLMGNNFEGPLPPEISKLEQLEYLRVSDLRSSNGFSFPPLSKLKNLETLILRNCSISGQIPEYIGDLSSLTYLDLSFNNLTGEVPKSISNLSLDFMLLTGNRLTGSIPFPKSALTMGDFSDNNFTNVSFTRPNNNSDVNLFSCCSPATFDMTSPSQIMDKFCPDKKSKYSSFYINCGGESTNINGSYYEEDSNSSAFSVSKSGSWAYSRSGDFITLSYSPKNYTRKMTCGISVPDAPLYSTARLSPLSLKYYGLCLHKGNYTVKLHFAEIIYTDDKDYSSKGTRIFDVYIQGDKVLKDFNIKDKTGGPNKTLTMNFTASVTEHLLEIHFYWAGKGSLTIPPYLYGPLISAISVTPDFKLGSRKLSTLSITMIAVASFVVPLLVLALIWRIGWLGRKRLHDNEPIKLQGSSVTSVTFHEIMVSTRNFSPKSEIGRGGFGTVYKAELQQKGIALAVKQLSPNSKQGTLEYKNEVFALSSLKHENLVQLFGSYSGNNQHLLIYEFMENNSLAQALFDPKLRLKLNWQTRHKICLGIAKGLTYLHEESRLKIVHRDIKATNILLDKDLNAKISDFGLAKLYDGEPTYMVTRVGGTYGYMAPEYAMRGLSSEKVDVYSFGVVTLEIVCGKSNEEYRPNQESVFLLDLVYVKNKEGKLLDLVDKEVKYESDYSAEEATMMLNLGMLCTSQSPTLRPKMSEVVSILEGTKTIEQVSNYRTEACGDHLSTDIPSTSTDREISVEPHHDIDESAISHQPS